MEQWVRLCGLGDAPAEGTVMEAEADGVAVCLARIGGELSAVDNWCPHRRGPLGQGWVEGNAVVCPWHSWTFDVRTGEAEFPVKEHIAVFPLRLEGEDVLIDLRNRPEAIEEQG
jgi:nitrite reductase (NADH) small subunit